MSLKNWLLLFSIILIAFSLRLYRLAQVPVNLDWDEVAVGYNAYSILKTGRDEFGRSFPVLFESFNDYKHPGLIYSVVPSIAIFGLNPFAVRLPAVLYGTATVFVLFFLMRSLTKHTALSGLATSLLAISPWHLQVSRVAFEQIGMVFWVVLGTWALIHGTEHRKWLVVSAISFALSFYYYYSVRLFLPFFLLTLFLLYRNVLSMKWILIALLGGVLVLLPLLLEVASPKGIIRASQVSIFSDAGINLNQREWRAKHGNSLVGKIFHQKATVWLGAAVQGYVAHFSLPFLFFDNEQVGRHAPRMMGMLYALESPLFLLGLYAIVKRKTKADIVLLAWLLLAPFPAMLAVPTPHALRAILMVIPLMAIIAWGIILLYEYVQSYSWLKIGFAISMVLIYSWSFGFYLDDYYLHSAKLSATDWADGHEQLFTYVRPRLDQYRQVAMTGYLWRPYIFMLFYLQTDPRIWQVNPNHAHSGNWYFGVSSWEQGDPHYKPDFNWEEILSEPGTLAILSEEEAGKLLYSENKRAHYRGLTTIKDANGKAVFEIMERV